MAVGTLMSWWSRWSRGSTRPLLCIGHSHLSCVARAASAESYPLQSLNFWEKPNAVRQESGAFHLDSAIEQQVREYDGPVFSMIGGAAHVVVGLAVHPRRFDFVLPTEPALPLDPAAELIPSLAVQRIMETQMAECLGLMAAVRALSTGQMFHVEPPPPSPATERMRAGIPWVLFPGRCRELSPITLRYKLWRLHSQILSGWCAEAGVDLVPAPPETMDAEGALREPYYGDGVHANAKYGALVLRQMRQLA